MKMTMLSACVAAALCGSAHAVRLSAEGRGQALIYPYYTANAVDGNVFNTYLSITNHASDDKAVRVRFREARMGASVGELNVYLGRNDIWTGAIVPFGAGAMLVSSDRSCTEPRLDVAGDSPIFLPAGLHFSNAAYRDDGAGGGFDRTREGYIEVLEMATLTGSSAAAVTHNAAGTPFNCNAIAVAPPTTAAPTGDLSGTLTLINVATGFDFTANAVALADMASRPYFRRSSDPYPAFDAAEIDPVSSVIANGFHYRSLWNSGRDAVTAVLMAPVTEGEFVLDAATRSRSDLHVTFPTRPYHVAGTGSAGPFQRPMAWSPGCAGGNGISGELVLVDAFDRGQRAYTLPRSDFSPPVIFEKLCGVANAVPIARATANTITGSVALGYSPSFNASGTYVVPAQFFDNGRVRLRSDAIPRHGMTSLPASTRIDLLQGTTTAGTHRFEGLPVVGFTLRTFENGTLSCGTTSCQGNYGGVFPLTYTRTITVAP